MNVEVSLVIGLLLGIVYAATRRTLFTPGPRLTGGAMIVKWGSGIGRASVVESKGGTIRLNSPVMRQAYAPPEPGSAILIKPLGGGPVQRAHFIANCDSEWTVRLGS